MAATTALLLLGGCWGQKPAPDKGIACFPVDASRWVYTTKADAVGAGPAESADATAIIYVDHSGSMAGYVRDKSALEKPFQDLVGTLPETLHQIGVSAEFRTFGRSVSGPVANGARILSEKTAYSCASPDLSHCDNQESHLDQVLARVSAQPKEMAVILSDLWFTNSEIQTSGIAALQPMLSDILHAGRVIALYGIDAPFSGRISDLPGGGPDDPRSIPFDGRHPLFMMVVGTKRQVLDFGDQLKGSGSRGVATGMANGRIHRSIFTVDPGPLNPRQKEPLDKGREPRLRAGTFEGPPHGTLIQQFTLSPAIQPARSAASSPNWTGPRADSFIDDAVWEGPLVPTTRIWLRKDSACTPASWVGQSPMESGWTPLGDRGQLRLDLTPAQLIGRLRQPKGVYLLSGQLHRTSVLSPNAANAWMRSDWNLTPEAAAATAARPPALFPTLNLSEFARLMESALATAAKRQAEERRSGDAVAGFAVMVKVD